MQGRGLPARLQEGFDGGASCPSGLSAMIVTPGVGMSFQVHHCDNKKFTGGEVIYG